MDGVPAAALPAVDGLHVMTRAAGGVATGGHRALVLLTCDLTVADTETAANVLPDPVDAQIAVGAPREHTRLKRVEYQPYESEIVNMVVDTICIAIV